MPIALLALYTTATLPVFAAEKAPWVVVRLHGTTLSGTDPNGIWSKEELRSAQAGKPVSTDVGTAQVPAGEVLISQILEIGCNEECPTRVVLRRPGKPDAVLLDDYVYVGTPVSEARDADVIYRVRSDLSELDGGTGTSGKAAWPGGPGGVLELDRSGVK